MTLGVASVLMLAAFLIGLHVASTLGILSMALMYFFSDRPLWEMLGLISWNANTSFVVVAVPLSTRLAFLRPRSVFGSRWFGLTKPAALTMPESWLLPISIALAAFSLALSSASSPLKPGASASTLSTLGLTSTL